MRSRPFASADPFLKLILLFLLSFTCLGVFMLMAQGITSFVWGISFFENQEALQAYDHPHAIYIHWILLLFQHLGLFIVPSLLFAILVHPEPKRVLGFQRTQPRTIIAAVLIMVAAMPLVNALSWFNELLRLPEWMSAFEAALQDMEQQAMKLTGLLTGSGDWRFLLINLVVMAVVPAIGEEMIFRGLVLRILESWSAKKHAAVWVSAAMFSGLHLQFYGFLPRLVLGALLGYLFVWSRSLWVPIAAHFTNNALALFLMFLIARGDISADVDGFEAEIADVVALVVSLLLVGLIGVFVRRDGLNRGV